MRINLGLQCIQLTLPFLLLFQQHIIHQTPDLFYCRLQRSSQMFHLGKSANVNIRLHVSCFPFFHGIIQFFQWFRNTGRYHLIQENDHKHGQNQQQYKEQPGLIHAHIKSTHWNHTDNFPSGVADGFHCHQTILPLIVILVASILPSGCLTIVFLIEIGINHLLLGMIDDLSISIHQV